MVPLDSSRADSAEPFVARTGSVEYRVTLTLSVEDAAALWSAAAARTMRTFALTHEDVLDTIGACEEAEIADCLAAVLLPLDLPGCRAQDLRIDAVPVLSTVAPVPTLGLLGPSDRQAA